MDNFLSWDYVASFVGVVFCTSMCVEFLKEISIFKKLPTKYFSAMVSFTLIFFASIFLGSFKLVDIPLMILNSILVTFTTSGQHDFHNKKNKIESR